MNNDPWSQSIEAVQPSAKPEWLTPSIEEALNAHGYPLSNDGMLMLWQKSKEMLDKWKSFEMEWRKICAAFLVPAKTEGTVTVPLGNDFNAKVNHKYNYSIKEDNRTTWNILDKIRKIGNIGSVVADRLISWSPSFLKSEYNNLIDDAENGNEDAKAILKIINDELIIVEPAAPELKIVEPKAKKK